MESKEVLLHIRKKHHLSQEEMASRLMVTRQAVSRWENGETIPSIDTLKIISKEFDVSIHTLLGQPRQLICQLCGMPLDDDGVISREADGRFNESYCKWCFADGKFAYDSLESLISFLVPHLSSLHHMPEDEVRKMLDAQLPQLAHWQK